jgi:hypothetical protein
MKQIKIGFMISRVVEATSMFLLMILRLRFQFEGLYGSAIFAGGTDC